MTVSSSQRVRVVLADDHVVVREGLKSLLQNEGFEVIGEASDGHAAAAMCDTLQPDVAVLDIAMPLLNGIDATRDILKRRPQTRVVLLTMYPEQWYVIAGLRAGMPSRRGPTNHSCSMARRCGWRPEPGPRGIWSPRFPGRAGP